ncbi:alkaline phosphatase family protein [Nocardioides mangrovicus]|uniref:Alkaline phosphatase family protein n=1 Tax=Nocardioides mangrovicus TaxID=2478913 RepID=A0A3L8P387_9ACTN|nr:alkaline phosphatase family protein [Nocardioides mangrovicus]
MVELVEPVYGGRTLADVLPAVGVALGVDAGFAPVSLELPPAPSYVVMLVDGMGRELLAAHRDHAPYLSSLLARSEPGTAGVPSTTATSLTSLGTALPPGGHGMVGFTQRVPGTEQLLNSLFWDADVDPLQWQPHETAFDRLSRAGVVTTVVSKREFRGTGLTVASQRGAALVGGDHVGERIASAVAASAYAPSVTYVYESDLDWTGHRFGVDSPAWRQQLITIDAQVEQLREALPPSTRLVVVADHGMVDTGPEHQVDVDETPGLRDGVALLGGEARFRHVYAAPGAAADVAATWAEVLADRALVLPREEAIARGWFGAVEDRVAPRLGDVVAAAGDRTALVSSADFPYEMKLIGMHGSLTPAEMLIPVLVD